MIDKYPCIYVARKFLMLDCHACKVVFLKLEMQTTILTAIQISPLQTEHIDCVPWNWQIDFWIFSCTFQNRNIQEANNSHPLELLPTRTWLETTTVLPVEGNNYKKF
jgi:hypothetical protein